MGRGRKGILTQTHKKLKSNRRLNMKREANIGSRNKQIKSATTEINLQEDVLDFMKNMNPQQLADSLLSNEDDWHVKTSSGNASGN